MVLVGIKKIVRSSDKKPLMILHFVDDGESVDNGNGTLVEVCPADADYEKLIGENVHIEYRKSYDGKAILNKIYKEA